MNYIEEIHDLLIEFGYATEEEISLVTAIKGTSEDAYNDILFIRTGYRSLEQFYDVA